MASSAKQRKKQLRQKEVLRQKRYAQRENDLLPFPTVRMSDVIRHLAEPIIDALGDTHDDLEWILTATITAWNLTLFSPDAQGKQFERLVRKHAVQNPEAIATFRWICDIVAERKMRFYPHLNSTILDIYFTRESANTFYFEVAYSVIPYTVRQA